VRSIAAWQTRTAASPFRLGTNGVARSADPAQPAPTPGSTLGLWQHASLILTLEGIPMSTSRRVILQAGAISLAAPAFFHRPAAAADAVRVGVLFSQTGGLSIIEKSLADATLMAIAEVNAKGGVLGRQIQPIVEDGASDPKTFNEKASKLVIQDKVPSVFACYTSASRKAVLPVFERRASLLLYPTYYEGFECSKNVAYTGAVPNQQLSNFIPWIIKTLGKKKFFIVGSNYTPST
jgi:urea transport system substrate-binding protein